ncbi:MAG: Lrp/AsnC family transcriptional regulator [Nanoarchaeota archaeon]
MEELSEIDRKVLYELSRNSKQSYKQIARNIKSKKEVVAYHINELLKRQIITKFVPIFSLSKLGILSHKVYLKLQGLTLEKEDKLIKDLIKDKKVAWIAKSIGRWDLLLGFYAKNIIEFAKIKDRILSKLSKYVEEYNLTFIEDAIILNRDYLLNDKRKETSEFSFAGEFKIQRLDDLDLKIIQIIKNEARIPLLDIAKCLNVDARTIKNRIRELEKRRILQGQTVFIDLDKLGFQLHKLCVTFKNYNSTDFERVVNYCKQNPKIIHIIKSLGSWELELEIEDNNLQDIYDFIRLLKNEFAAIIKHIELVTIVKEPKLDFFPDFVD